MTPSPPKDNSNPTLFLVQAAGGSALPVGVGFALIARGRAARR